MTATKIEWADKVWNPVTGCTKVSEGCRHCYAERMSKRLAGRHGYPDLHPFKVTMHPGRLDEPVKWKKPARVFVCSMGDLFHEDVPDEYIARVLNVPMRGAHRHTYMILTKRPERARAWLEGFYNGTGKAVACHGEDGPIPTQPAHNVYIGVSVEDQETADERIPILLQIPAVKRFVSIEPVIDPVNISNYLPFAVHYDTIPHGNCSDPARCDCKCEGCLKDKIGHYRCLDWVILGGETGPGARPVHPNWMLTVRDQCQSAGVPFFFKQWGEWGNNYTPVIYKIGNPKQSVKYHRWDDGTIVWRVGKKAAGCFCDDREYKEFPS